MDPNTHDPLSVLIAASARLLRRNPALWLTGFLAGVLVVLLLSRAASAWSTADALQAVLALGLVALTFPLGWLLRDAAMQRLAGRRQRLAVRRESPEE